MAKKAAVETPAEDVSQEEPEFALNGTPGETPSKAEAVRRAMAAGLDSPGDIADFARSKFGLEIAKPQVSAYKAQTKAKERGNEPRTQAAMPAGMLPPSFGQDLKLLKQLIEDAGGGDKLKDLNNSLASLRQKYGASFDDMVDAFE